MPNEGSRKEFEKHTKAMTDLTVFVRNGFKQLQQRQTPTSDGRLDQKDPESRVIVQTE